MASVSVLHVYVSFQSLSFLLVSVFICIVCGLFSLWYYGDAHNGLHQNNSAFSSEDVVCVTVMR